MHGLTRRGIATTAVGIALLAGAPAHAAERPLPSRRVFTFDEAVYESSGLVDRGRRVYTVNDSGDEAVVYGVDSRTGRTVSRTTYADDVRDVEALAPGRAGTVWVADIGDNRANRDDVTVHQVRPKDGEQPADSFSLTYPDGPRDAEALLVHPRTQRLYVVTKSPFGGAVYAAPRRLGGGANELRRVATLTGGLVTDGAFTSDGRRVLLRTYTTVSLYSFPGFEELGTRELPAQQQGEGISVSRRGRVLVTSEGVRADVLRLGLPRGWVGAQPAAAEQPPPAPAPPEQEPGPRGLADWLGVGVVAAGVAGLGWLALRASRLRSPRSR